MGITYNEQEQRFEFDFVHDGTSDLVSLTGNGYQVEAFGRCFYYGYEFAEQVSGALRTEFIKYLKFTPSLQEHPQLTQFIKKEESDIRKRLLAGSRF